MPPFGIPFFNKKRPEQEASPRSVIYTALDGEPDARQKILTPEFRDDVKNYIKEEGLGKHTIVIFTIFAEKQKLSDLEDTINFENLTNCLEHTPEALPELIKLFSVNNINIKNETLANAVNKHLQKYITKNFFLTGFVKFITILIDNDIPFDPNIIQSTITLNFIEDKLKFRQTEGIKDLLNILSKIGITVDIESSLDSIKMGIDYAFKNDHYDVNFVNNMVDYLMLVKHTKIQQEVSSYLNNILDNKEMESFKQDIHKKAGI